MLRFSPNHNRVSGSSSNIYQRRSISAGISRSIDAANVKERIDSCKIVSLFRDLSLDAGYILNILYSLDKLSEMKAKEQQSNGPPQDIEQEFMQKFWKDISKFSIENAAESIEANAPQTGDAQNIDGHVAEDSSAISNDFGSNLDTLLSMAFESYTSNIKGGTKCDTAIVEHSFNCYDIYTRCVHICCMLSSIEASRNIILNIIHWFSISRICNVTDFPMPLSITIYERLREILRSRISIANEYVLRIFLDEYNVLDHLINLQRVYFFGAGDLMHTFYSRLFKSVSRF